MAACMACSLIAWLLMRTDTPYTFIPLTVLGNSNPRFIYAFIHFNNFENTVTLFGTKLKLCIICKGFYYSGHLSKQTVSYCFKVQVAIIVCLVLAGMGLVFSSMKWSLSGLSNTGTFFLYLKIKKFSIEFSPSRCHRKRLCRNKWRLCHPQNWDCALQHSL